MNKIWALFESGHIAGVRTSLYQAPADHSRLLDAYVTTECSGSVTRSARRSAEAILNWLAQGQQPQKPLVASFDFTGLPTESALAGESCGLAFSIALAAALTGKIKGEIAATGIVEGTDILPVKSITQKLEGALKTLPENSFVFFPSGNIDEVSEGIFQTALDLKIKLIPVASIEEALKILCSNSQPINASEKASPPRKTNLLKGIITLFTLVILGTAFYAANKPVKSSSITGEALRLSNENVTGAETVFWDELSLTVNSELEKKTARIFLEKLSERMNSHDRFSGELKLEKKMHPSGDLWVDATVVNAVIKTKGGNHKLPELVISAKDTDKVQIDIGQQLAQIVLTNFTEITRSTTPAKTNNSIESSVNAGQGFD